MTEIDGQSAIDGFILLSEYWSDDKKRNARIYHRPFGGYMAKFFNNGNFSSRIYSNTEIDAEGHAEEFVK